MRRHFAAESIVTTPLHLSIEEEAILEDEMNLHSAELDGILEDSDRLGDIVVTMGDAQATVSNTPEIGTMEQELVSAVADMAVAGTDADPEDITKDMLPPAEGLSAESILESAGAMLKKIWDGIKAMMTKIWDHIKNFFMRIGEFITGTKRRIEKLEKLVTESGDTLKDRIIDAKDVFHGPLAELTIKGEATKEVGKDYSELASWFKDVIDGMVTATEDSMDGGTKVMEGFLRNPKLVDNNLEVFTHDMTEPVIKLSKLMGVSFGGVSQDDDRASKHLGSLSILGNLPDKHFTNTFSDKTPTTLESLRNFSSMIRVRAESGSGNYSLGQIAKVVPLTNNVDEVKKVLTASQGYVKLVESKGRMISAIGDHNKKARDAIDKIVAEASNEKLDADSKAIMKELLGINGKMSSMFAGLIQKLVVSNNRTTNAVLDYCIQSCELKPLKQAA